VDETNLKLSNDCSINQAEKNSSGPRLDWPLCLMVLLAAAVVLPRSYLMAQAHSEAFDDAYHLKRGLAFLTRSLAGSDLELNDPPLGEGIVALPMLVTNLMEGREPADDRLYDAPQRAETLAVRIALWNSVVFVGFLGVVFCWCRRIYGPWPAWFAAALFVVEPNFAAHIPIAALDVIGVEGIVVAALLAWRYFERPTTGRLLGMGLGAAFALMLKHTAVVLPVVIVVFAGLHWVLRPWLSRQRWVDWKLALPGRVRSLAILAAIAPVGIWPLSLFDCSPPLNRSAVERQSIGEGGGPVGQGKALRVALERSLHLDAPWPAGCYLRAFRSGMAHGVTGHLSYLNGQRREQGWWSYFPIVASYKVPIGIGLVMLISLFTIRQVPPRWAEWGLFVPMLAWTLFALGSKVNLGFRHFLPAYAFMLMLGGRCVAGSGRGWSTLAWAGVAVAGLHVMTYYPDYLCYINAPWPKPHLAISDCNVDWGQALKQVRVWLDANPQANKRVSLFYFGNEEGSVDYYLQDRVVSLDQYSPRPTDGLLLISPVRLAGAYELADPYAALRAYEADAVIGNSILVFDLDRIGGGAPFRWPPPTIRPAVGSHTNPKRKRGPQTISSLTRRIRIASAAMFSLGRVVDSTSGFASKAS
jgi:Dolichyl-phosphate-mannose-protein mannosyltransferase